MEPIPTGAAQPESDAVGKLTDSAALLICFVSVFASLRFTLSSDFWMEYCITVVVDRAEKIPRLSKIPENYNSNSAFSKTLIPIPTEKLN